MKKLAIASRVREHVINGRVSSIDFEKEVDGVGLGVIASLAGLVGAWSLVCLISGLCSAHGPINFLVSWFMAVFGF